MEFHKPFLSHTRVLLTGHSSDSSSTSYFQEKAKGKVDSSRPPLPGRESDRLNDGRDNHGLRERDSEDELPCTRCPSVSEFGLCSGRTCLRPVYDP